MTRKKVKLAFIANNSSRKATYKKRNNGLFKKLHEITTLCDVPACAIVYSPYNANPEVWPTNGGVRKVIDDFRKLPEVEQQKKMMDQETFLRERIAKETEHLNRQMKERREREMTEIMFNCFNGDMKMFNFNIMDLNDLCYIIDQNLKHVKHRLEILKNCGESSNDAQGEAEAAVEGIGTITLVGAATAPTAPTPMVSEAGSSSSTKVAAFFNPNQHHQHQHVPQPQQQQFHYPPAPSVGFYEQPRNLNLSMSQNLNQTHQQWFMEMKNHPEHMSYIAGLMGFSHHHLYQHQPLQQQIHGEFSTAPTASSNFIIPDTTNDNHQPQLNQHIPEDSSTAPASTNSTNPNFTNNI